MTTPEKPFTFTSTEFLVLEILAEHTGSGYQVWPFESRFNDALNQLKRHGLIKFKRDTKHYSVVWLTKTGVELMFPSGSAYPRFLPSSRYQPRPAAPATTPKQIKPTITKGLSWQHQKKITKLSNLHLPKF